jgi:type I restriction enzyme R subunit
MPDPEKLAREEIDALLGPCGWVVQDKNAVNLIASRGVAVRELTFKTGEADYALFVDGKAIGTLEAKPVNANFQRVTRLRQSILCQAFSGDSRSC